MLYRLFRRCTVPALLLAAAAPAGAQDTLPRPHAAHAAAPWLGAGAALAGAALLDRSIAAEVPHGGGERWHWASSRLNYLGRPQYAALALAATWAGASAGGARGVRAAAEHVGVALLVSGAANGALKTGVGRERPRFTRDPFRFTPFTLHDSLQSLPSGHAVVAFSLAAAISAEARTPWVTAATYGTAALVGWSRVYDDRHWTSDVVAGALVGAASARWTVRQLHRGRVNGASPGVTLRALPGGLAVPLPLGSRG